eukprot:CAMPEP_0176090094 /NCGR_PEP_ID=MMETSP0120_2-20121206/45122_1 /TAXON_ID=160619 /ORGANISM="Kryptoperidinium foliaceum, Strain CCMP 1326" /LENGTH=81 /DNA_ID=CAMNT_0017423977 /DNA_START=188 /DNA_END=430 /DNA_ORIENTATION=+
MKHTKEPTRAMTPKPLPVLVLTVLAALLSQPAIVRFKVAFTNECGSEVAFVSNSPLKVELNRLPSSPAAPAESVATMRRPA